MKIIEPSVELVDKVSYADICNKIERCGRVCYQSQPHEETVGEFVRNDSAIPFIRRLIKRGHESVLEHVSLTFHIICDRAIQNELVRHRLASFSVESTRYVKYDELTFIKPPFDEDELSPGYTTVADNEEETFFEKLPNKYQAWKDIMDNVQAVYRYLIHCKARPEDARAVLPMCLKSELYMTANLREWRHILKLRTNAKAHPQMRQVAGLILKIFRNNFPVFVEDIS